MADESDVETTIATLVTGLVYPLGISAPSVLGPLVRIYRGWPNPTALNADLAAGVINVSLFPDPSQHRITTRYIDPPTAAAPITPSLTVSVTANTATFAGMAALGQLAGLLVDNTAVVHRTVASDTPEQVAATLATYLRASRIVQLNGTSITIPNAGLVIGRVVADQQTQTETRRQQQGIRLSCWCPTPTIRDQTAILIDAGLSQQTFLTLPDGTTARLCETGTRVFDQSQNANLYRRDLLLSAEYATTITTPLPAMIFGNSLISPNGVTTRSRIG
jgi:hypothetical protein